MTLPLHVPINKSRTACAEKNDKLGWTAGFSIEIDGLVVGVRSNSSEILPTLRSYFPVWAQSVAQREVEVLFSLLVGRASQHKGVKHYHLLYKGWSRLARTFELEEGLTTLRNSVWPEIVYRADGVTYCNCQHVLWKDKSILLFGPQPELTAVTQELIKQADFVYRDELVALAGDGSARLVTNELVTTVRPALALLVEPRKSRRLKPRSVPAGESAMRMLETTTAVLLKPKAAMTNLAKVAGAVPAYSAGFRDPVRTAEFIHQRLS